jgi:hypothetical protein
MVEYLQRCWSLANGYATLKTAEANDPVHRVVPREVGRNIYGYLNRVQSSRRLEREAGRNVEVMCEHAKAATRPLRPRWRGADDEPCATCWHVTTTLRAPPSCPAPTQCH